MRILHLNTFESAGGAARAVDRLHKGLRSHGISSRLLVRDKTTDSPDVHVAPPKKWQWNMDFAGPIRSSIGRFIWRKIAVPDRFSILVEGMCSRDIKSEVDSFAPDIINCHWICCDFVSFSDLANLSVPLVWTLHDSWPFTGGCHVPGECRKYEDFCGPCESLKSGESDDLSRWIMKKKEARYKKLDLTLVAPSKWLAERASSSRLFRNRPVEIIPNGLDTSVYRPIDKKTARDVLCVPRDKKIIAFGAIAAMTDHNKGYPQLFEALSILSQAYPNEHVHLITFGTCQEMGQGIIGFPLTHLGRLHDDLSLALAYSAADVMVVPSLHEAFGQTASEAMACGTPVVAFNGSGVSDIVDHHINGFLAQQLSVQDLAHGIRWALENEDSMLCHEARKKAETSFSLESVCQRYVSLYERILKSRIKC